MTSKVEPSTDHSTVDRENLGTRLCYYLVSRKTKSEMVKLLQEQRSLMNDVVKQFNIEFGFRRISRISLDG